MFLSKSFVRKYLQISTITIIITIIVMSTFFIHQMDKRFKMDLMNVEASYIKVRTDELEKSVDKFEYYLNRDSLAITKNFSKLSLSIVNKVIKILEKQDVLLNHEDMSEQFDKLISSFSYSSVFIYNATGEILYSQIPTQRKCATIYKDELIFNGSFNKIIDKLGDGNEVILNTNILGDCFGITNNMMFSFVKKDIKHNVIIGASALYNWEKIRYKEKRIRTFNRMNRSQIFAEKENVYLYEILDIDSDKMFAKVVVHPDESKLGSIFGVSENDDYIQKVIEGLRKNGNIFITHWKVVDGGIKIPVLSYFRIHEALGFVISSSVKLTGVNLFMRIQEERLLGERDHLILLIIIFGISFIFLVSFFNIFIGKQMKKEVRVFNDYFKDLAFTHKSIDLSDIKSSEFELLGKYANNMLQDLFDKQREIKSLNENLETRVIEKTKELNELNKNLEDKVAIEVLKNRNKDKVIYEKSRHAAMGELLINISHHWRQPLNNIGLLLQFLEDELKDSNKISINEVLKEFVKLSTSLSEIKNIYDNIDSEKSFYIFKQVEIVKNLMSNELRNKGINIKENVDNSLMLTGSSERFINVLNSLIHNSMDAIFDNSVEDGWIDISVEQKDTKVLICIEDNGGGISINNFDKIFAPYFTSKCRSFDKGLSLYKTKIIIENNFHGIINVMNTRSGAKFIIEISDE